MSNFCWSKIAQRWFKHNFEGFPCLNERNVQLLLILLLQINRDQQKVAFSDKKRHKKPLNIKLGSDFYKNNDKCY